MPSKTIGLGFESFFVGRSRPVAINSLTSRVGKVKSAIVSVPLGLKFLAAQLVVLSGDIMLNPGPFHSEFACPSQRLGFCNKSFQLWIVKATAMSHLQVNSTRQWTRWMTLNLICILTWIYRTKA